MNSSFKRRVFIKSAVIAGIGTSVLNMDPNLAKGNMPKEANAIKPSGSVKKIVVGGGGIGGMCCAYDL
jgi:monoamine oxidase